MRRLTCLLLLALPTTLALADGPADATALAQASMRAHGVERWWGTRALRADVRIVFGGKVAVDGTFTFETNAGRARYDMRSGPSVLFDGKTAWAMPAGAQVPRGRFHVLTWPWFVYAPFKQDGSGVKLGEIEHRTFRGKRYATILQTFAKGEGDTPDDWYRLYIDPQTKRLAAMSYIVTYGRSLAKAQQSVSIIVYSNEIDVDGCWIARDLTFYKVDAKTEQPLGPPKATGQVRNLQFVHPVEGLFSKPAGATELKLPPAN